MRQVSDLSGPVFGQAITVKSKAHTYTNKRDRSQTCLYNCIPVIVFIETILVFPEIMFKIE